MNGWLEGDIAMLGEVRVEVLDIEPQVVLVKLPDATARWVDYRALEEPDEN
jgi:hypothetical protein